MSTVDDKNENISFMPTEKLPLNKNLKNITNSWPSASNLQNLFSTHFSWPQYPGKIQNDTRTNCSNRERSGQLW